MADYKATLTGDIIRTSDGTAFPPDPGNADYRAYLAWEEIPGNDADPADPVDPTPQRVAAFTAAEDQERLRLVAERSRTDPAFAALAELALGGDR